MRCAPDLPQLASRGSDKLKRLLWIVVRTNGSPQLVRSTQSPRPLECQLEGRRLSFRLRRRGEGRRVALDSSARGGGYQRCTCDGAKQWQRPQWLCAVNSPGSAACRAASTGNTANLYRGWPVRSFCFEIFLLRSKAGACGRTAARLAAGLLSLTGPGIQEYCERRALEGVPFACVVWSCDTSRSGSMAPRPSDVPSEPQ